VTERSDRRRAPRHKKIIRLEFEDAGRLARGATVDISQYGAFVNSGVYVPVGSLLAMTVASDGPGAGVRVWARVVHWIEPGSRLSIVPGFGVQFVALESDEGRIAIERFMQEVVGVDPAELDGTRFEERQDGMVRYTLDPSVPLEGTAVDPSAYAPLPLDDAPRVVEERRASHRFQVRTECTYFIDGLPHSGIIFNIGARGFLVLTQQVLPEIGQEIVCRMPLTGKFREHWIRCRGIVRDHRQLGSSRASAFAVDLHAVDELGNEGVFADYLAYLQAQQGHGSGGR